MTDQNDLDPPPDLEEENLFDDFEGGGGSFGEMFRENPLVKIGVVLGGFAAIIGGVILFGGEEAEGPRSAIRASSEVKGEVGDEKITPAMKEALEQVNQEEVEKAIAEGTSALPVPIAQPKGLVPVPEESPDEEDPLDRWRRIQEERAQREREAQQKPEDTTDEEAAALQALTEAMSTQMESVLSTIEPAEAKVHNVSSPEWLHEHEMELIDRQIERVEKAKELATAMGLAPEEGAAGAPGVAGAAAGAGEVNEIDIIVPAGTIEYAQLLIEANSDVPGPILAQLVSGPLAGSRLIGSFEQQEGYLVLNFNVVVIDGVSYMISAVAVNPETANIGMVTDINQRYFKRIILPAAAAFIEGFGEAIAESGTTANVVTGGSVVVETQEPDAEEELYKGVEKAAEKVSEIVDEEAESTQPQVKVAVGTPMGILFLEPVTEQTQ